MFTPRSALEPVLGSVYSALNTTGITGLAPVYGNFVPEGIRPPYVAIRAATEMPWPTIGAQGSEIVVPVESVSVADGDLPVIQLASAVRTALDRAALAGTSGYTVTACRWESNVPDEDIVDGVRYRFITSLFRIKVAQIA